MKYAKIMPKKKNTFLVKKWQDIDNFVCYEY
jgi:hypothetical protein